MKKALFFLLIPVLIFGMGIYWFKAAALPVAKEGKGQDFLIIKGASASIIGNKLKKEGLIRSSLAFKIYVQMTGQAGKIQAGEYFLNPALSLPEIVNELVRGPLGVWVTIPEGWRREEIAWRFAETLKKTNKEDFVREFLEASVGREGFLFPDTYLFLRTAGPEAVVEKLIRTFDSKMLQFQSALLDEKLGNRLNNKEIITVASLVERETKTDTERPIVAGIIYKRLKADWPLQVDAALQYAVAGIRCQASAVKCDWWPVLTKEDLLVKSPFNTYKYSGLPPAPIANPGLSSLKAAIYPEESLFWFYLHDQDGKIHYAETIEKHNQNVRLYLGK